MAKGNFNSDLRRLVKEGDLKVADLSKWFDTPYATTYTWIHHGRALSRGLKDNVLHRLTLLRKAVDRGDFPVPVSETALTRPAYVRKIRDAALRARVPGPRTARVRA